MARARGERDHPDSMADHEQFASILNRYGPALGRLAALYEWDPTERQDLQQEIALAIWRALPAFRGDSSERTFVFRIAHNRGLSHRWRHRHAGNTQPPGENLRTAEDPAADLLRRERRDQLLRAVARLPEAWQPVVQLALEGLSNLEIGDVLGISPGNVAVRLTRARRRLRELLEPQEDP